MLASRKDLRNDNSYPQFLSTGSPGGHADSHPGYPQTIPKRAYSGTIFAAIGRSLGFPPWRARGGDATRARPDNVSLCPVANDILTGRAVAPSGQDPRRADQRRRTAPWVRTASGGGVSAGPGAAIPLSTAVSPSRTGRAEPRRRGADLEPSSPVGRRDRCSAGAAAPRPVADPATIAYPHRRAARPHGAARRRGEERRAKEQEAAWPSTWKPSGQSGTS